MKTNRFSVMKAMKVLCWISVLTFALLEIGLRFVLGNSGMPAMQIDNRDGRCLALKPSTSTEYTGWFLRRPPVRHDVNAMGYRGQERPLVKPVTHIRILMIGDSFTYGQGVNEDKTIPHWLECFLQEKVKASRTVEVLNIGLPGLNLEDSLMVYRKFASKFKHDLVIYNFFSNDFDQSLCDLRNMRMTLWCFKNIYTYRLLRVLLKRKIPPESNSSPEEKKTRLLKTIDGFLETSALTDASFAIVFLYGGDVDKNIMSFARQLSAERKFLILDVNSQCINAKENIPWIYGDGHYSEEGNHFVASCISEWLQSSGFLRKSQ